MSLSVGNTSSPSSTQVIPKYFSALESAKDEVGKLINEGLVGEDTVIAQRLDYKQVTVEYWSNKDNAQWQAYESAGSALGETAAGYQVQMIQERQELADSYLSSFLKLAKKLNDANINASSLSEALDNHPDKSLNNDLKSFLNEHSGEVNTVRHFYSAIKEFPKDLKSWLDYKDITSTTELSNFLENMKYEWANSEGSDDSDIPEGYTSLISTFILSESDLEQSTKESISDPVQKFENILLDSAQGWASTGDTSQLAKYVAASLVFSEFRGDIYQQYKVLNNSLSTLDTGQFSTDSIDFTVYDMVDNYLSGKPVSILPNGNSHPNEGLILDFWGENKLLIEQYISKREGLESFPKTLGEFRSSYNNLIEKYTIENFDELMNLSSV